MFQSGYPFCTQGPGGQQEQTGNQAGISRGLFTVELSLERWHGCTVLVADECKSPAVDMLEAKVGRKGGN